MQRKPSSRYPMLTRCSQMIRREASMTGEEGSQPRDPCCEQYGRVVYERLPVVRIIFYKGKGRPQQDFYARACATEVATHIRQKEQQESAM